MTEIEAVKERHSVRKYTEKKIEPEKAEKIACLIEECNREGNLHMQFIPEAEKIYSRTLNMARGLGGAPGVIACAGPDDGTLEERIGYYGEKVVLFAQTLGLNTCWAGMFNAKNVAARIGEGERLVIVIAIGYGANQGVQRRSKDYSEVVEGEDEKPEWFRYGVELALLAPTAVNQQKFRFGIDENGEVYVTEGKGPFSRVDKGIVRYHFDLGASFVREQAGE